MRRRYDVACRVGKVSDHKVSDRKHIKISTPKQMLQRLSIVLAQVNAGNISENLLNEIKLYILCVEQKKLLKLYTTI